MKKIFFPDDADIVDPCIDEVFKAIFTKNTPESRGALTRLLSAYLEQDLRVITVTANEPPIDDLRERRIRYDISVNLHNGEMANIEMTVDPDSFETRRLEYYAAKLYLTQDIRGKTRSYRDLQRVYQLSILAKRSIFKDQALIHRFKYYDKEHEVEFGGQTEIIVVELEKTGEAAEKTTGEMTRKEQWAVFFRYCTDKSKRPLINDILAQEEGIAMAGAVIQGFTKKEIEYLHEMSKLKYELDMQSRETYAWEDGMEAGREAARLEMAQYLVNKGWTVEEVADASKLALEKVQALYGSKG